ncbi:sensor histidine kinase [Clostridium tunisiense]|uniref:sensor histidine kinase n=1 Tax=Clostridium tunisiense TaxID=219748 RepID=UPI0002E6932C|nr:sensor histidine kinase [Clostridium tunisiense]
MDTNSNNNKENKFIKSTLGTLISILLLTFIAVGSYLPLKSTFLPHKDNTKEYLESYNFSNTLAQLTAYFTSPEWYDNRYEDLKSIKYIVSKDKSTNTFTNMQDISKEAVDREKENGEFYLQLKVDEVGNTTVETSSAIKFDKSDFLNNLGLKNKSNLINKNLFNLEATYIVPKNLESYNDFFVQNIKSNSIEPNIILIMSIGAIGVFILMIIAFSVPYSYQEKVDICNLYNKMYLELKFFLWMVLGIIFLGGLRELNNNFMVNGPLDLVNIIYSGNQYFYLIGIPVTFVLFLLTYLTFVYFKYIYFNGFKNGFIRNSIFGRLALYTLRKLRSLVKRIFSLDLNKKEDEKLLFVLVINLFVLWIIAATSFMGAIIAIGYTAFLFRYLHNVINRIKALNEGSKQLAQGEFDVVVDENIGILSPVATNLNNIKNGFKLAIDKEITSEKMKTELISNVSHDLKTPLTSIITYVDLLKSENLTEENRKEYIDILDRKSKRLKGLIEDLFEASKASSGNVELQLEKLDVVALFKQTLGELEEKINNSTLQMKIAAPENKILCNLDGRRTYRIFENIMTNILKYSMENTRVYITIVEDEQEVSFTFKNISSYEMNFSPEEITERFTRGDRARNTEGSGLGLAIAKSLIVLQRGTLNIEVDGDLFKLKVTFPKAKQI